MRRRPRPYLQSAVGEAVQRIAQQVEQQTRRELSAGYAPPTTVRQWRHPLLQDRGQIEVTTLGQAGAQYVEGPCLHPRAVPVESVLGELLAWLCPGCDEQLPAEWSAQ